ncbi:MAG: DUF881 domain-containing protein [Rubrobacteridae bacterium]|nr:DUF881 domain-containing protein [Rubrobacteridae bacterium]
MKKGLDILRSLTSHATRTEIAIGLVCLLIGLLFVTQMRAQQSSSNALQTASESDLSQIVGNLNSEIYALKAENADLRLQLFKIERTNNDSAAVMSESFKNLNNLKIIAGLTKVMGPGVKMRVSDRNGSINENDLVDIITELRVGGAEALSINGVRIVSQTGVIKKGRRIFVGENQVSAPYEINAIGNPDVLQETLAIAGGIKDKLSSLTGVSVSIAKISSISINPTTNIMQNLSLGR